MELRGCLPLSCVCPIKCPVIDAKSRTECTRLAGTRLYITSSIQPFLLPSLIGPFPIKIWQMSDQDHVIRDWKLWNNKKHKQQRKREEEREREREVDREWGRERERGRGEREDERERGRERDWEGRRVRERERGERVEGGREGDRAFQLCHLKGLWHKKIYTIW